MMERKSVWSAVLTCAISLAACSQEQADGDTDAGAAIAAEAGVGASRAALAACAALGGAVPKSVTEVVDRINVLPTPSIACLVASLPRPLSLVASISPVSAQPSTGFDNPRIFVMLGALTLSVLPADYGADRLEFGEWVTPLRTLKAELHFPVERPVAANKPYEGLAEPGKPYSTCGSCHTAEAQHDTIDGAFVSNALRPGRYADLEISEVRAVRDACDAPDGGDAPQCELLRALFDYGEVDQGAFDPAVERGF